MGGGAVFNGFVDFEMVGYSFILCVVLTIVIEEVTAHSAPAFVPAAHHHAFILLTEVPTPLSHPQSRRQSRASQLT
jgi:hypothetical protein